MRAASTLPPLNRSYVAAADAAYSADLYSASYDYETVADDYEYTDTLESARRQAVGASHEPRDPVGLTRLHRTTRYHYATRSTQSR
jgi:hypothetical protein